jgi:cell division protein FtsW
VLLVIGLVVVYSIGPGLAAIRNVSDNYFVTKQLTAIAIGLVAFGVAAVIPLKFWQSIQRPLIAAACVATLIALITPLSPEYPAHRWIRFGGLSFQSVELIKIAILVCVSSFFATQVARGELNNEKKTLQPLVVVLGLLGVVVAILQKDLGSAVVLVAMIVSMGYVAGVPLKRLIQGGVLIVGIMALLVLPFSYRRDRVFNFVNPEANCQTSGYQACQALIAVGSGGLTGKGLGYGAQAFGYLPEAANDSIFAIMAEKFGFLGMSAVIALFAALFTRLIRILERAPDMTSRLLVAGVLTWLSVQTLINIGAMIGLLPLKGITLPFISYGGTSIIFVLAALGMVFQISRYTTFGINIADDELPEPGERRRVNESPTDWRRNRRPYHATTSGR